MKALVGRVARKLAPRTFASLDYIEQIRQTNGEHDVSDVLQMATEMKRLRERVSELESRITVVDDVHTAIDEHRRDTLRVAELTDLVVTRLRRAD